jgi:uncharacterized protein (DUF58 family)
MPDLPAALEVEGGAVAARLEPRRRTLIELAVVPRARGRFSLRGVYLAAGTRLGLWRRLHRLGPECEILVYPNLNQLSEYAVLARTNRLSLIGVRRVPRIGGDTEFERLQDYQSGDSLRTVDWKATARRDVVTVRAFQVSQSQSLMLMLDAGRMMSASPEGRDGVTASLLDRAIDAALMMAHVALIKGDRVGLIAYASSVLRYVPPHGGARHLTRLIHAVHDLHPQMVESRHDLAFLTLAARERKRSLVVVISNVMDEVNAAILQAHLRQLAHRHLALTVLFKDRDLFAALERAPASEQELYRAGAAADLVNSRRRALDELARAGVLALESFPEQLTTTVVNEYLAIKAKHLL